MTVQPLAVPLLQFWRNLPVPWDSVPEARYPLVMTPWEFDALIGGRGFKLVVLEGDQVVRRTAGMVFGVARYVREDEFLYEVRGKLETYREIERSLEGNRYHRDVVSDGKGLHDLLDTASAPESGPPLSVRARKYVVGRRDLAGRLLERCIEDDLLHLFFGRSVRAVFGITVVSLVLIKGLSIFCKESEPLALSSLLTNHVFPGC